MATRQATLLIRDRQVTGGGLPANALMAEPFVNLYDGILKFSGVTGGGYEPSDVSTVFEVGSTLYNSRITNRLNINDNFIISGGTGLISTYGGVAGAGLDGKFLSGTTDGFVLGNISDIQGVTDITRVQSGTNITTGGTDNFPTVNLVDSPSVNNLTASGTSNFTGAIQSGGTDLYTIFLTSGDLSGTSVSAGSNVAVNQVGNDYEISVVASPSFNDILFSGSAIGGSVQTGVGTFISMSAATISGDTIYSAGTDLYNIFVTTDTNDITRVQPGTNITTGGTDNFPTVNVVSSPVFTGLVSATGFTDSSLTAGRVVYVGTSGRLVDEAGFEYDDVNNLLYAPTLQVGTNGTTGTTLTVYGDILALGAAISGFTSELYIEDNNIFLNYNPTASTESASLGAGFTIQDGSGSVGTDVYWDIRGTGVGVANRGFVTNLNDIYIRNTNSDTSNPDGVRVIAELDVIDGGSY